MVNLQKSGDRAVKFVFTDSDHYLYGNGEIEVPVNSLLLVIDESEMVTFKKLSGDPFLSFRADNSNLGTKEAIEQFYKENMVGAAGISEEEVQDMIDAATSGIPSSQVVEALRNDLNTVSGDVADKQDKLQYYSETDDIEYGSKGSDIAISQGTDENNVNVTFGVGTIYTEDEKSSGVYIQTDINNDDGIVGSHINVENGFIDISNEYTPNEGELSESHIYMSNNGSIEIGNRNENGGTLMYIQPTGVTINDERVLTEGNVDNVLNSGSTNPVQNAVITQALNNKLDASAYTPTDLSQYWTSAQTQTAIDDAKAYYVDFAAMSVQGITDADWDGLVAAINAHRPILVKIGTYNSYVTATYSIISDNVITITGADGNYASTYTFTKNGSNDYSVSTSTKQFVTQAEKAAWNAKVDTSAITTAITSGSTDTEIPTAKAVYDATQSGGGGMDDDTQQLISTAFNDLNDRKADLTELTKYQKKGDYVKTSTLSNYMTNDAFDEYATAKERIISGALNDLNDKFGGIRLVKISQADYDALTEKSENTLYIINNVI